MFSRAARSVKAPIDQKRSLVRMLASKCEAYFTLLNKQKAMFVLAILKAMRRKSAYFSSHVTLTCILTLSVPASIGTGAAEAIGAAARFSK